MRVSELAKRAGVAPSAIRFYERTGVLPAAARRANGYRDYGDDALVRLRLVVALRRLDLPALDAGRVAARCLEGRPLDVDLGPVLAEQRAAIARRRAELDRLEAELADLEETVAAAGRDQREAPMTGRPIRVLFVCTGNSGRSQIAEAMLRELGGVDFEAFSAGTLPGEVSPWTVRVLGEVGIDWSAARSKSVDTFVGQPFDYIVTVCDRARQACPVFPGEHDALHWGLDDPAEVEGTAEQKLAAYRRTRQELAARLRPFVELARRSRGRSALG